jgi:hypothetical protein
LLLFFFNTKRFKNTNVFQPFFKDEHLNLKKKRMIRLLFLFAVLILSAAQCQTDIDPEYSKVVGKWTLYKIGLGYPMPGLPLDLPPSNAETLEIDANEKMFIRKVDGIITEKSKIEIRKLPENSPNARLALVFLNDKTYSFLSFDEAKNEMGLYQKCPLEAELADGNTFYYTRQ